MMGLGKLPRVAQYDPGKKGSVALNPVELG